MQIAVPLLTATLRNSRLYDETSDIAIALYEDGKLFVDTHGMAMEDTPPIFDTDFGISREIFEQAKTAFDFSVYNYTQEEAISAFQKTL